MRTYSRDAFFAAKEAWRAFPGPTWEKVRRAASEWSIFPPSMDGMDERDSDSPHQRVIVWFAVENRPAETLDIIRRARSWSDVCQRIFAAEGDHRETAKLGEEGAELERRYQRGQYRGRMEAVGEILGRWRDSAA